MISYEGYLRVNNPSDNGLIDREYNIEIVNYKNGSPAPYHTYELEGESKMREYGFEVEFVLDNESKPSGKKMPDMAKISYFKNANDKVDFERDPAHKSIETLYPSTIDSVVWISGKIHPMTVR